MSLEKTLKTLERDHKDAIARLFEWVEIPSISTDPAFKGDIERAAKWLCDDLASLRFDASVRQTKGHPMVVAHYRSKAAPDGVHVLFYGHYDVQPADPVELWDKDPFKPYIRTINGMEQMVGRGISDDKGQVMTFVEACRATLASTGDLPVNVSFMVEGEEESGGGSIEPFLTENAAEFADVDFALICDTAQVDAQTPAISVALRGMVYDEVTIHAANRDLHSGFYGGAAQNPIHILGKIIGEMHDENGAVTLEGFYDGVPHLPQNIRDQWASIGLRDESFLGDIGLKHSSGEKGYTALEQTWARPALDVNGIWSGYTGVGAKTVIAAQASAKISCRLVGTQDPLAIRAALRKFITDRLPSDCSAEFHGHGASPAVVLPTEGAAVNAARSALKDEWDKEAVLVYCGGSIPIAGQFKKLLNLESLMVGFGLEDDAIHSPNEKYNVESFRKGARSWARILSALAKPE